MLLTCTYDNLNKVLKLFTEGKIVNLFIRSINDRQDKVYCIKYDTLNTIDESFKESAQKLLEESIPQRVKVTAILEDFIKHFTVNAVKNFSITFNVVGTHQCQLNYVISYDNITHLDAPVVPVSPAEYVTPEDNLQRLIQALDLYDNVVLDLGIHEQQVPNLYRREGTGKGRKNYPITVGELGKIIRSVLKK